MSLSPTKYRSAKSWSLALQAAARASSKDNSNNDSTYKSSEVPNTTGENVGQKLSEQQEKDGAEKHKEQTGLKDEEEKAEKEDKEEKDE